MASTAPDDVPHSKPIPINTRRGRAESVSDSSSEESASPVSPSSSPIAGLPPRVATASPGSTPILNYFLSQSPKSPSTATFPFRRAFGTAVFEDDSESDFNASKRGHARSVSSAAWPATERVSPPAQPAAQPVAGDRAAGLLRRLSLGGTALRPQLPQVKTAAPTAPAERVPPNTPAVEQPPPPTAVPRKTRRANTLAPGTARPKRAPSPMGERILTGHFDGFN